MFNLVWDLFFEEFVLIIYWCESNILHSNPFIVRLILQIILNTDEKKYGGRDIISSEQYLKRSIRKRLAFSFLFTLFLCLSFVCAQYISVCCHFVHSPCTTIAESMVSRTAYKCYYLVELLRSVIYVYVYITILVMGICVVLGAKFYL